MHLTTRLHRRAAMVAGLAVVILLAGAALPAASSPAAAIDPAHRRVPGRDKTLWPFDSNSIWNVPVGSAAIYVPAHLSPPGQGWGVDENPIVMSPGSTPREVYTNGLWPGSCLAVTDAGLQLPVPTNFVVTVANGNSGTQPNYAGGILAADGSTIYDGETVMRCVNSGPITMNALRAAYSIYGDGRPSFGGQGGSGMSGVGGSIRLGELTGPHRIRHALKITLDCERFCHAIDRSTPGFRWPAVSADANQPYGSRAAFPPPVGLGMGALLALPPSVDINALGLATAPARKLAWTLQNYGVYVVDNAGPDQGVWNRELIGAQIGVYSEMQHAGLTMETWNNPNSWDRDMSRLFTNLQLVDSNGPSRVGGGGSPRQPLAPPISN